MTTTATIMTSDSPRHQVKAGCMSLQIQDICKAQKIPAPEWKSDPNLGVTLTFHAPESTLQVGTMSHDKHLGSTGEVRRLLWTYQNATGQIKAGDRLLPSHETIFLFKKMLREEWRETIEMVDKAHKQAQQRRPA